MPDKYLNLLPFILSSGASRMTLNPQRIIEAVVIALVAALASSQLINYRLDRLDRSVDILTTDVQQNKRVMGDRWTATDHHKWLAEHRLELAERFRGLDVRIDKHHPLGPSE
jgi:hypothetical protein